MRTFFCAVLLCLHVAANASSESTEMKRVIDTMQEVYHVSFVYDSALADVTPAGRPLPDKTLAENLNIVFGGTGIKWEIKDEYVLLFRQNKYTFSGYVCQDNGESLINVTVYDKTTRTGTLTDEHGFFSITLPEGKHVLRVSYIGYEEVVKELDLQSDYFGTIYLKESTTALAGVEVTANLNDPLLPLRPKGFFYSRIAEYGILSVEFSGSCQVHSELAGCFFRYGIAFRAVCTWRSE